MSKSNPSTYSFALLFDLANKLQVLGDRHLKGTGITTKQWFLTLLISMENETPSIGRCAELMGSSHQNIKQLLNKLKEQGMVHLVADSGDKRKQRVELSKECIAFWDKRAHRDQERIQELFAPFEAEELSYFAASLERLRKHFIKELEK
jgi:DNA-binding MarR family transcriptional regulator